MYFKITGNMNLGKKLLFKLTKIVLAKDSENHLSQHPEIKS